MDIDPTRIVVLVVIGVFFWFWLPATEKGRTDRDRVILWAAVMALAVFVLFILGPCQGDAIACYDRR